MSSTWSTLQIGIGGALIFGILTGLAMVILAEPMALRLFHEPQLIPLLRLFGLIVPFMALSSVLVGASRGFKKQQYPVIANDIGQSLIRMILILILALAGLNAFLASMATGVAIIAASGILFYLLHREFSFRRPLRFDRADAREIVAYSVPVLLSSLLKKFRGNLQALLLGVFSTVTSVGIFLIASKINTFGRVASLAIMESAQPVIADLYGRQDMVQLGQVYQSTSRWIFLLNLPFVLVMILLPEPILSIFGETFAEGATVLTILAFANLVNVSTGMSGVVIDMTGYTKLKLANSVLQLALFFLLNFLFIPRWGIVGAAYASLISLSSMHLLRQLQVWLLFRHWPYNRSFIKPAIAGLVTAAMALMVHRLLPPDTNLFLAALEAAGIFVFYGAALLLLGLEDEDRTVFLNLLSHGRRRLAALWSSLAGVLLNRRMKPAPFGKRSAP